MKKHYKLWAVVCLLLWPAIQASAQTITADAFTPAGPFCSGATPSIGFTVVGPPAAFLVTQTFTAEISDDAGVFPLIPNIIGTASGTGSGSIALTLPTVATTGTGYLIRITATPDLVAATTATAFTIMPVPVPTITPSPAGAVCTGAAVTYTTEAGQSNYMWSFSGAPGVNYTLAPGTGIPTSNTAVVTWMTAGMQNVAVNYSNGACTGVTAAGTTTQVNPSVATPVFAAGPTSTRCQGAGLVSYGATATNNTTLTFTLLTVPADPGTTINAGNGDVTYSAGFSGAATITATATGCSGPTTANHVVTVTPTVGTPAFSLGATSTRCQGAATLSYTANATNNTGITYTLLTSPADPGTTINATTGDVTYSSGFSGTATITASAAGCNGPVTNTHTVTVTSTIGTPVFTVGPATTRCQGAGSVTYGATSAGSTGIIYSLLTVPNDPSTTINASTGAVSYSAGFSGTATITATAGGCNGPKAANFAVTVTPTVSAPVFTAGPATTRCQGAAGIAYGATAANTTGITYSLLTVPNDPSTTINASNGTVSYSAGFAGTATITASAAGCNGPAINTFAVTVTATVGTPIFTAGPLNTRCQGAGSVAYGATATTTTGITYSLLTVPNDPSTTINASNGTVSYGAGFSGTATITASAAGCNGPAINTFVVTVTATVGTPVFGLGAASTRCQAAGGVTYTATATTNTGITYSLLTSPSDPSTTINASTGAVSYSAGFAGTATVTATATGCNGPKIASHVVTVVGYPVFTAGPPNTRCQGFGTVTYAATAVNATGITYTLLTSPASASVINAATGAVTYDPNFVGTASITASTAGCATLLTTTYFVNVAAGVGTASFTGASPTACQGATVTYTATAAANTGIVYSISTNPGSGATINASTGVVNYGAGFTGSAIITAVASGCGPSTSATQSVVITPVVTQPVFNVGPSGTICQNAGTITYTATAANTTSPLVYSLSPAGAGTINTATGAVSYNSGFTGAASISVTATGCNGSQSSSFPVTVSPTVGVPAFTLGAGSVRKQGVATVTYTATAANTTGITYALSPASAGNIIPTTGAVTYNGSFSGTAVITAAAAGCNATAAQTITHTVTVVQTPVFASSLLNTRCQVRGTVTYSAPSSNGTVTYYLSTSPAAPGTTININTGTVSFDSTFSGTATISAVSTNGSVVTDTAKFVVSVLTAPRLTSPTPTSKTICSGDNTNISLVATSGAGSTFAWTVAGGANITGKAPGNISVIGQTLVNTNASAPDSLYYIVSVTSPAPASCPSVISDSIKVRVNPKPVLNTIAPITVCSGASFNISLGASTPSNFSYTVSAPATITNASPGGGSSVISQSLTNTDVSLPPAVPTSGTATYTITPTSLLGCVGNPGTAQVTVNPLPVVIFPAGASKTICSGTSTNITLSANIASKFTFTPGLKTSLGLISGQKLDSGSTINQILRDTSNYFADSIFYSVVATTTTGTGCVNTNNPGTVVVAVNPSPVLTSALTDKICSGQTTATPLSASVPSTYAWTIGAATSSTITGQLPLAASSAVTSISQTLTNTSSVNPGFVDYVVTPTSTSFPNCPGRQDTVRITVNPLPKLVNISPISLCSDSVLDYTPQSSVAAGTTVFAYERNAIVNSIPNQNLRTTTHIADLLSSDHIYTPTAVDYNFTLTSAQNCTLAGQHLSVTVNPTPDTPGISVFPRTKLCSGVMNMNFSTSRQPDPREYFKWSSNGGAAPIQKPDSGFSQNALISFLNAGNATVTIDAYARGFGCKSKSTTRNFGINTGAGQGVNVALFSGNLIAQASGVKAYQWGFDRKSDLDSTMLPGENTQNYDTRHGFNTAANFYWVMVTFSDDCVQKTYFNGPTLGVTPAAKNSVDMKLYPNPVQDVLTLELTQTANTKDLVFDIYDLAGKRLYQVAGNSAKTQIPVGGLTPGYYVIACTQAGIRIATSRFIKN